MADITNSENILYSDLKADLVDRIARAIDLGRVPSKMRIEINNERRLAKACTQALLDFVKVGNASQLPDLVFDVPLLSNRSFQNVAAYKIPVQTFGEREDSGVLSVILSGEELPWGGNSSLESVVFRANNEIYGRCDPCFSFNEFKKTIYVPCALSLSLEIVSTPHNIRSPYYKPGVGALIVIDSPPGGAGTMNISDKTNSIAVTFDGTETLIELAEAIKVAVNAATTFYFNAYTPDGTDRVQFNISPEAPLNGNVALSYSGLGGAQDPTVTLTETGTYLLPVGDTYFDTVVEMAFNHLISSDVSGSSSKNEVPSEEKVENKTPEKQ